MSEPSPTVGLATPRAPVAYPSQARAVRRSGGEPDGVAAPGREQFRALAADHAVVPVHRRLLADGETPVGAYRRLAGGPGTFLLESAEHGRSWSRYSFVGVRCPAVLTEVDGRAVWRGTPPPGVPVPQGDPLSALREVTEALRSPRLPGLPPLTGGLVGFLSYDLVRGIERLPESAEDDLGLPALLLMLTTELAVLDHHDGTVLLVANAVRPQDADGGVDAAYDQALARLDAMEQRLAAPAASSVAAVPEVAPPAPHRRTEHGGFPAAVERAKEHVRDGDVFQVNLSQRFELPCEADALDVYRVLRTTNPSPYMYLLRFDGFDVVGSSPETHLQVTGDRARLKPIAGTKPRGATPEEDVATAQVLLSDPKERSEHVMLVDLARNDLGRVCTPGSVEVVEFFTVERYSHVMHIVSRVEGRLAAGGTAVDALVATFPAGTLTGAPKVRAMEIIDDLEPTRRGIYAGTCGYVDFAGDCDMAITIRTALLRDGRAYVQAGAGIVADSDPWSEDRESEHKAAAVLQAVASAGALRPVPPPA